MFGFLPKRPFKGFEIKWILRKREKERGRKREGEREREKERGREIIKD